MTARRGIDVSSLAAAVSRPGVDPRVWLSVAHVTAVGFDAAEGMFADLVLLPGNVVETAYMGAPYAGTLCGDHCPLEVGDTVLVAVPGGDPNEGPVIVARWNNAGGDPPHPDFAEGDEPSPHRQIRVREGNKLMLRTSGASGLMSLVSEDGDAELTAPSGVSHLGNEPGQAADDWPAQEAKLLAELQRVSSEITALKNAVYTAFNSLVIPPGGGSGAAVAAVFQSSTAAIPGQIAQVLGARKVKVS